jgi:hypothetical protein
MPGIECAGYAESATTIQLRWPKSGNKAFNSRFQSGFVIPGATVMVAVLDPGSFQFFVGAHRHLAAFP